MTRLIFALFTVTTAACLAQTKEPSDTWLMQNYRFAPPPRPGEIQPVGPALAQLQEVQTTTLNILRKANLEWNFEAALAAAAQATANAELIGALTGELKPPVPPAAPPHRGAGTAAPKPEDPIYLVALRDQSIHAASSVWRDDFMFHYITRAGAHEQVRLDLVDWKLSAELNHMPPPARVPAAR